MRLCIERDNWLVQAASAAHLPLPHLYNVGPIGAPQPFRTVHGEWGPPMGRISEIDWELYSVALICCDVLLSVAWHIMAAQMLKYVRIKWLSPTFRVSVGYVFGTMRLSLVIYFFRARPLAAYTYLHAISFVLHCTMGLVALLFGDGPWGHLRPNEFGLFEREHQLNPYSALPFFVKFVQSRIEYWFWGSLQWLVDCFQKRPTLAGFLQIRLLPASSIVDSGLEKIALIQSTFSNTFSPPSSPTTSTSASGRSRLALGIRWPSRNRNLATSSSWNKNALVVETKTESESNVAEKPHRIVSDPIEVNGEIVELNGPEDPTNNKDNLHGEPSSTSSVTGDHAKLIAHTTDHGPQQGQFWSPPFGPAQANITVPTLQSTTYDENSWSRLEDESAEPGQVILVGPAQFKLRVSQAKWNASILFWALPSIESYFGQRIRKSPEHGGALSPSSRFRTECSQLQVLLECQRQNPHQTQSSERSGQLSPRYKPGPLGPSQPPPAESPRFRKQRSASLPGASSPETHSPPRRRVKRSRSFRSNSSKEGLLGEFDSVLDEPVLKSKVLASGSSGPTGWSALEAFVNRSGELSDSDSEDSGDEMEMFVEKQVYGLPVRGTITLRGDGVLLSISPSPPKVREILKVARQFGSKSPETREVVVELIGRRVTYKTGSTVRYTYAEYRSFGMHLSTRSQATLLSVLNKLNGSSDVSLLRTFREKNSLQ